MNIAIFTAAAQEEGYARRPEAVLCTETVLAWHGGPCKRRFQDFTCKTGCVHQKKFGRDRNNRNSIHNRNSIARGVLFFSKDRFPE